MEKTDNSKTSILYKRAEELLRKHPQETALHVLVPILKRIREQEIYQIEQEMKTEELELALKRAELQDENFYCSSFSTNPAVMMLVDPVTGDIKDANPAACRYYGWSHSLLCTRNIAQINEQTQQELLAEIQKTKKDKRNHFVFRHRLPNDEIRDVEVISSPKQGTSSSLLFSFVPDITEKKIAEEKLSKGEETYRKLVGTINDTIYEVTNEGIIKYASPSIVRILGYFPEEVIGKHINNFIHEDDKQMIDRILSSVYTKDSSCIECRCIDKKGDVKWIRTSTVSIVGQGNLTGKAGTLTDITEFKLKEEALRLNKAINRKMIENIGDVFLILNREGTIRFMGHNVEKWFGWNSEEFVGSSFWKHIYPDDLDSVKNFIETLSKTPDTNGKTKFRYQCRNGRYKWIKFSAFNRLHNSDIHGFLGHYDNITKRMQAESQFNLLIKIIEQSPVSVMVTNSQGNIEYVNPEFTRVTGYTLDEIEGKTPRFLQSGEHSGDFYKNLWETILSGNNWHGEFRNRKKNGELVWENTIISPVVNSRGDIDYFFAVKEDITEKKTLTEDLTKFKEKAEESNRLKIAFLSNISHEVRTPLNGILGFADLLKEPGLSDETKKEYISIIEKSGARMLKTMNDIMDISKIEAGQVITSVSETNITELIEHIFSLSKSAVEQKEIQLILRNSLSASEAKIKTDHQKVYRIISGLIDNAIKFTKKGSIEIGCNPGYKALQPEIEIYVKDTGIGISSEKMKTIFEKFRQGSESLSWSYEGAGLGLAISKAYTEILGGRIWVESELKKGSTFFFTIPYKNF